MISSSSVKEEILPSKICFLQFLLRQEKKPNVENVASCSSEKIPVESHRQARHLQTNSELLLFPQCLACSPWGENTLRKSISWFNIHYRMSEFYWTQPSSTNICSFNVAAEWNSDGFGRWTGCPAHHWTVPGIRMHYFICPEAVWKDQTSPKHCFWIVPMLRKSHNELKSVFFEIQVNLFDSELLFLGIRSIAEIESLQIGFGEFKCLRCDMFFSRKPQKKVRNWIPAGVLG